MLSQKSVLARLLANENITVQQGNFETASFNVETRVLNLPMWKDMSRDVYDMLVGHEVAHALFTPQNFHEYMSEGIPHSWLNVVEDVRIEKLILRKYPGLVSNFKRGYTKLMREQDLFGIKGKDLSKFGFMDRLNIHAKARDLIEVPFTDEEMPYVLQAKSCETYEDVVQCCRDIQAWLKEKEEEQEEAPEIPQVSMNGNPDSDESGEEDGQESSSASSSGENETEDTDEDTEGAPSASGEEGDQSEDDGDASEEEDDSEEEEEDSEEEEDENVASKENEPESGSSTDEAITDVIWSEASKELSATSDNVIYAEGCTREIAMSSIIPYKEIARGRAIRSAKLSFPEQSYQNFLKETKQVVNMMVKEFEMRKAAYRSQRARVSTKGTLDVNKLHRYKYDDHLFQQVAKLADAKSHGMIMMIDRSGSMYYDMPAVLRQTLALVMFCRRVNIPFEVYSFTSYDSSRSVWKDFHETRKSLTDSSITRFEDGQMALLELFSSKMSRSDFDEACRMTWWQTVYSNKYLSVGSEYEDYGSTPLNYALMAMTYVIEEFRKKYSVQKMNFITLTDGDSNRPHFQFGKDLVGTAPIYRHRKSIVSYGGRQIEWTRPNYYNTYTGLDFTAALLREIEKMGVTTINYYLCSHKKELTNELKRTCKTDEEIKAARRDIREKGCFVIDENLGYNRRFILFSSTDAMDGKIEDLEVDGDMTATKIAKAFNKSNSSKKKSRVITQKFAEMVA